MERWNLVHYIFLLKDPPKSYMDRFRNIMLIEVDLMFLMEDVLDGQLAKKISVTQEH